MEEEIQLRNEGELRGEIISLRGRVRKLEREFRKTSKLFEAVLKQLANIQNENSQEPIEFEFTSSREKRKRRKT